MRHLNTTKCECGTQLTAHDMTGRLEPVKEKGLFGGNVKAFAPGKCPSCEKEYKLWLRQAKNTWQVVTLEDPAPRVIDADADEFEAMSKNELKAWLDERSITYTANWGEKRLREFCREFVEEDGE